MHTSLVEGALMESEASVLATFDFLQENNGDDDEENLRYDHRVLLSSVIVLVFCNSQKLS